MRSYEAQKKRRIRSPGNLEGCFGSGPTLVGGVGMEDIDIWRVAEQMRKLYGADAAILRNRHNFGLLPGLAAFNRRQISSAFARAASSAAGIVGP